MKRSTEERDVSVIVPVHNEEQTLDQCLISVRSQEVDEIIIVLDRCTDNSPRIAKEHGHRDSRIKVLSLSRHEFKNNYIAETINLGISQAKSDVICIADADTIFQRNYVCLLLPSLSKPVVSVSGRWIPIHKRFLHFFETVLGTGRLLFRQVWNEVGGFKDVLGWDTFFDLELLKKGYEIKRIERVVMYDVRHYSMKQLAERAIQRGRARRQIGQSIIFMLGHGFYCLTKTPFGIIELIANVAGYLISDRRVSRDFMKQYEVKRICEMLQKLKPARI